VDVAGFEKLMEEQRERARAAQKREVITVETNEGSVTKFIGFDTTQTEALVQQTGEGFVVLDQTPFYAEMGGQLGDSGHLEINGKNIPVSDTKKSGSTFVHRVTDISPLTAGTKVLAIVDQPRRARIEAHHSVTHLMHWALRRVLGNTVAQKGSYVGPDGLRFDFSHLEAMTPDQIAEVERHVNEKIEANDAVAWTERPYTEVKGDSSILQFFGDKYGEFVRVVDIGGYSKELCGGTHVRKTGDIGYFKLLSESAIAAGVRRIEAASGAALIDHVIAELAKQEERHSLLKKRRPEVAALLGFNREPNAKENWKQFSARQSQLETLDAEVREWEKVEAKKAEAQLQSQGVTQAEALIPLASEVNGTPAILANLGDLPSAILPHVADALKTRWKGVSVLATVGGGRVALLAAVSPDYVKKVQAGKIIQAIAPLVGGKGGGRPELAQGGGADVSKVSEALEKAKSLL
jgi:alanyl-tRNA synthetase